MIWGFDAVKIFFVISGFYMALILNEKYLLKTDSYKLFITNRILRLYPLYLITFIASLIMYMLYAQFSYNPYTDFIPLLSGKVLHEC